MKKIYRSQTIRDLRRRNQALVKKTSDMRKRVKVFMDKKEIAECAMALMMIKDIEWPKAVVLAREALKAQRDYLEDDEIDKGYE